MAKQLTRSSTDRKVAGVAGGIAQYLGVDATLVRVLWFLAMFLGGTGFLAYIILWVMLPEGPQSPATSAAIGVAEERYARGEITAEELALIRRDLQH